MSPSDEILCVILLIIFTIVASRWGPKLVWKLIIGSFKVAQALMVIVLIWVLFNTGFVYHHFGQTPIGWLLHEPNYFSLPPGAPDPEWEDHYIPGAPHAPVPKAYYDNQWWHHHKPKGPKYEGYTVTHNELHEEVAIDQSTGCRYTTHADGHVSSTCSRDFGAPK